MPSFCMLAESSLRLAGARTSQKGAYQSYDLDYDTALRLQTDKFAHKVLIYSLQPMLFDVLVKLSFRRPRCSDQTC